MAGRALRIQTPAGPVSALLTGPRQGPLLILAHGAGGDMGNRTLEAFAGGLAEDGIRCLRFNFHYREEGKRAPDREPLLRETWLAALGRGAKLSDRVWAGGKSMGGRIASMVVADGAPADGLILVGYPLHPPGRPEKLRDAHLPRVSVPMLFLQGTADPFARWDLLERTVSRLPTATLHRVEGGDHSFRVKGKREPEDAIGRRLAGIASGFMLA